MNTFVEICVTNAIVATLLACVVWLVARFWRHPALVHALWVIVLVKLVTPPMFAVSWTWPQTVQHSSPNVSPQRVVGDMDRRQQTVESTRDSELSPVELVATAPPHQAAADSPRPDVSDMLSDDRGAALDTKLKSEVVEPKSALTSSDFPSLSALAIWLWVGGSMSWLTVAIFRIASFQRALRLARPAPEEVQQLAAGVAAKLGVRRYRLRMTEGRLAPLVWPMGQPTVLLSRALVDELSAADLQTLLAHEFAHIRRKDHWVRWLELVTTAIYWWHPVVWWARTAIHRAEEQACDAWAVWAFPGEARRYATALFTAAQFAAGKRQAAPSMASGLGSGRHLKERIEAIMNTSSNHQLSRRVRWALVLSMLLFVPLSLRFADAEDAAAPPPVEQRSATAEAKQVDAFQPTAPRTTESLEILEDQVRLLQEHAKHVEALYKEGLEGGSRDAVETANFELSRAKAELALSLGKIDDAAAALEDARRHAEQALKAVTARYEVGAVTQDVLFQANRNLLQARQTLMQMQNMKQASAKVASYVDEDSTRKPANATLHVGAAVIIRASGTPSDLPIADAFIVQPDGTVALGPTYGRVRVDGLTIAEAERAVEFLVQRIAKDATVQITVPAQTRWFEPRRVPIPSGVYKISPGDVLRVTVVGVLSEQPIADDFAVEPGGTLAFGPAYDRVSVGGLTLVEAEEAIKKTLEVKFRAIDAQVTIGGWQRGTRDAFGPVMETNAPARPNVEISGAMPLSRGVLRRLLEMKQMEFERVTQLSKNNAVPTADVDTKRYEMEIAKERLRQAERALKTYQIEVQIAEAEFATVKRANEKTPNSVTELELKKAELKLELAKAKFEEMAQ